MSQGLHAFETHRPRLMRIAYRMLGSVSDAEDVVQDAYLRWHQTDRGAVVAVEGLLIRTVVRLAIDRQRRLKTEREHYRGPWLPEPWPDADAARGADDLGFAAQVLLETLTPDERAAFLLREVFDLDYDFIADALEKTEPAARKLVQRAKERLAEAGLSRAPRYPLKRAEHSLLVAQLMAATSAQTSAELERLLTQAVQMRSDGGGKVFAAKEVLHGPARIATALWRIKRKLQPSLREYVVTLAGEPALASYRNGALFSISFFQIEEARVSGVYVLMNPDKVQPLAPLVDAQVTRMAGSQTNKGD